MGIFYFTGILFIGILSCLDFFLFGTEFAATGGTMDIQKKKRVYQARFFIFMAVSAGLLWFYIQSER